MTSVGVNDWQERLNITFLTGKNCYDSNQIKEMFKQAVATSVWQWRLIIKTDSNEVTLKSNISNTYTN